MTFTQCIDFFIRPSILKIFWMKSWEICIISPAATTIRPAWGFLTFLLGIDCRYSLKYRSLYPIDAQTEAWIREPRKLVDMQSCCLKWSLRIYISNQFLDTVAAADILGTTFTELLLLLRHLHWVVKGDLKEPNLAVLALVCLLSTKVMLYLVEIYFRIQSRLLLEELTFRTQHTAQGQLHRDEGQRGHQKAPEGCYLRPGFHNLFVTCFLSAYESSFSMTILKMDTFSEN